MGQGQAQICQNLPRSQQKPREIQPMSSELKRINPFGAATDLRSSGPKCHSQNKAFCRGPHAKLALFANVNF